MHNNKIRTTNQQSCDITSSQQPVTQQVTQSASKEQASTHSVLSKLVTARVCARARTREEDGPEGIITPDDLMAIRDAYVTYVGQPMTAMVAHEVEAALAEGMRPSVVIEAARVTGDAPRPTPYYMRAVLRRWIRDGILTDDALAADKAAFEQQQAAAPSKAWWQQTNPALRYEQHPIPDDDSLFTDLSALR
jgi:DNA replication protein DnaD